MKKKPMSKKDCNKTLCSNTRDKSCCLNSVDVSASKTSFGTNRRTSGSNATASISNNRMSPVKKAVNVSRKEDCNKTLCSNIKGKSCCLRAECKTKTSSCVCHVNTDCAVISRKATENVIQLNKGRDCDRTLCPKHECHSGKSICKMKMSKNGECRVISDCKQSKLNLDMSDKINMNSLAAQGYRNKVNNRSLGKLRDNKIIKRDKREATAGSNRVLRFNRVFMDKTKKRKKIKPNINYYKDNSFEKRSKQSSESKSDRDEKSDEKSQESSSKGKKNQKAKKKLAAVKNATKLLMMLTTTTPKSDEVDEFHSGEDPFDVIGLHDDTKIDPDIEGKQDVAEESEETTTTNSTVEKLPKTTKEFMYQEVVKTQLRTTTMATLRKIITKAVEVTHPHSNITEGLGTIRPMKKMADVDDSEEKDDDDDQQSIKLTCN